MSDIIISHDHETGTILTGSAKGDGVWEIARRWGFAYSRNVGIYVRGSRDRVANRYKLNGCAEALRTVGHTVTVDIDDTLRDIETVRADQAQRLDDRADALAAKATRKAGEAAAAWALSDRLVEHIPPGQPILVGHHSERRHRRTLERSRNAAFKGLALDREAATVAARAEAVGTAAAYSERPDVTARRIERLAAEQRDIARKLDGYTTRHLDGQRNPLYVFDHAAATGEWAKQLTARGEQVAQQLAADRAAVAAAVAAGRHAVYDASTIAVGDLVRAGTGWHRVAKVNKVTVAVETGYSWTNKVRYTEIRGHRKASDVQQDGGQA